MRRLWNNPIGWCLCLILSAVAPQLATAAGLLTPTDSNLPQLEIREHHVNVVIEDGYAITEVDQTFANPHDQQLEAVYTFPVPEKASVGEFTFWIDGKPVTGEVLPRKQARDLYEQERSQGRRTALTEQDEYRSFDSRVYPVLPNDTVRIRLVYIQPVHAELGIGRYVYPLEEGGVDEERMAFFTYQAHVQEAFSFKLTMRSSYPIDQFLLPAHPQAQVQRASDQEWQVSFANTAGATALTNEESGTTAPVSATAATGTGAFTLDRDIVAYWRHQPGLPGAVDMVTYRAEGSDRGTFMLTLTPGDDLGEISEGRDWTFVLDLSGSMAGKYHSLAEGVRKGLGKLQPQDRFRMVLFNDQAHELTNGYVAVNDANVAHYLQKLEAVQPDGGTNLFAGLKAAYRGLDADRPSAVILVTDGVANVGVVAKNAFLELLEQHDIRLFTFVMGNSANRPLLEGMAKVSNGFAMNISNSDDISGRLIQAADQLRHESYRDLSLTISENKSGNKSGIKVRDLSPGRIGTLYRGQQLIVFGHYWGDGAAKLDIEGKVSGRQVHYRSDLQFPATDTRNPELERLWAYAAIENIQNRMDYLGHDADSEDAIVDLAVEHGLVTPYTSMVVVEESVFEQLGVARNNNARVKRERTARENRAVAPVQDNRQDSAQPAFNSNRAYPRSSGGSGGPVLILLLLALVMARLRSSRNATGK
ncbi:VIT and VWA domain-containing protein [Microbulbifer bruguierae]|uniref:VIT and VWA domain-containing protein n=1 Tax=Microbulbifer bruguierae TaxID=3029061 RepID=A0ABY8NFB7_9GAMM|nr:VIT and VWA domain-containing protein [Microbulbifer bruguierae]WGL16188.1 VIT and VWA domain-containing protein [Microbulbifer bruguierae]